jgi:hypothetical protein
MTPARGQIAPVQEDQSVFIRSLVRAKPDTGPASRAQPGPNHTLLELLLATVVLFHVFSPRLQQFSFIVSNNIIRNRGNLTMDDPPPCHDHLFPGARVKKTLDSNTETYIS